MRRKVPSLARSALHLRPVLPLPRLTRRQVLQATAGLGVAGGLGLGSTRAQGAVSAADRRFLFVFANGVNAELDARGVVTAADRETALSALRSIDEVLGLLEGRRAAA